MDNDDFRKEILMCGKYPNNFLDKYAEFEKYQIDAIRTLDEFHRICTKNRISYQLAYGSLLGAVREGGQIPWDYDIDVFIKYSEKEMVFDALRNDLSDEFYFECPQTNKNFSSYMIRLAPKKYDTEAVHVDIFYTIGAPSDVEERSWFKERVKKLCTDRSRKKRLFRRSIDKSFISWFYYIVAKIIRLNRSVKQIDAELEELCLKYNPEETNETISVCTVYANVFEFEYYKLWETEIVELNNSSYIINVHADEVLSYIYGDYMKRPLLELRVGEFLHYYELLKWFDEYHAKYQEY